MSKAHLPVKDPDLAHVGSALKRAAARAKRLAQQTNTPLYVVRNGKIVNLLAGKRKALVNRGQSQRIPQR